MVQGYRALQHWDQWLTHQSLGQHLLGEEKDYLTHSLKAHYGKHALLIGTPSQATLLQSTDIPYQMLITPLNGVAVGSRVIGSDLHDLPILAGSMDLVLLPHTHEFIDNPRQLFLEACRIVKPEGLIVICGFNPYSLWGGLKPSASSRPVPPYKIKDWLSLADFVLEEKKTFCFRPPIKQYAWYDRLQWVERAAGFCFPFLGGAYLLLARAKAIPLTPIRMKWKQELAGIPLGPTITGHIARARS